MINDLHSNLSERSCERLETYSTTGDYMNRLLSDGV